MTNPILDFAAWMAGWLPPALTRQIYRVKPLAQMIRGFLNKAASSGLSEVSVAGGELAGMRMVLDLLSEKDYWLGTYEIELQAAVKDWVREGMVVYDLGANIGYISLLLGQFVGETGRVFAFEALPANVERLKANLQASGMGDRITIVPAAVVEQEGPVRFMVAPSAGMGKVQGSGGRQGVKYEEMIEVAGSSLDHFVFEAGNPAPAVVKMDIEGGEVLALVGMRRLLRDKRPVILLELHGEEADRAAWKELREAGYSLHHMRKWYPEIQSVEELSWKEYVVAVGENWVEERKRE